MGFTYQSLFALSKFYGETIKISKKFFTVVKIILFIEIV